MVVPITLDYYNAYIYSNKKKIKKELNTTLRSKPLTSLLLLFNVRFPFHVRTQGLYMRINKANLYFAYI